jgi:thioredoxin reductase (NADPH)
MMLVPGVHAWKEPESDMMFDVIIIGSGPAGCTAGIFSVRRNLKALIVSDPAGLSQAEEAVLVDDWPGELGIKGIELMEKFRGHARKLDVEFREDKVTEIKKAGKGFMVRGEKGSHEGRAVILATGARHRKGLVKGEDKFAGKGVSYCATCDGPLFRGKKVLVLGGGDSAVMYALLLEQLGADTTLVHRRDQLRAAEALQKKILKSKVRILWDTVCTEIRGDRAVKSAVLMNKKTNKKEVVRVDGVFVAFGTVPTSEVAKKLGVRMDKWGYIMVDKLQKTNVTGVFAAGDCCSNPSKKIVTAAGDGAIAAESAYDYLKG